MVLAEMSEIPFFKGRKSLVFLAGREFLVLSRYMISEVLSAGFWRCQDSFTSFYLISMSAQADSLFPLGPIVAAQHISVPLVSERSGDSAVC
jgi:hypothetical protein